MIIALSFYHNVVIHYSYRLYSLSELDMLVVVLQELEADAQARRDETIRQWQ